MFPPERIHHLIVAKIRIICRIPGFSGLIRTLFDDNKGGLEREICGLKFRHPVGLAAGFDKDATFFSDFANLGFSFIEIGTVTPKPQPGNHKPRSFRLPADQALINRMGFNNMGADAAAARLAKRPKSRLIIGGNIGKNSATPNADAPADYLYCFRALYNVVDYFTINVSCPNVGNLCQLQSEESLSAILEPLCKARSEREIYRPIFLKISPDNSYAQVDAALEVIRQKGIDGIVAVNTTTSREGLSTPSEKVSNIGNGGLSGKPLTERALAMVKHIALQTEGKLPIIAVGGIMTPNDALERIKAGAWLIQIYTGFIYEGPTFVKRILNALRRG